MRKTMNYSSDSYICYIKRNDTNSFLFTTRRANCTCNMVNFQIILVVTSTFLLNCCISMSKIHVAAEECSESITTLFPVSSCPKTAEEWGKAAGKKKCSSIKHSCSSFEYHCVINAWMNETVEVCAPKRRIIGKQCAEFSYGGNRIQSHLEATCHKCPSVYNSDECFKYQECYEKVSRHQGITASNFSTNSSDSATLVQTGNSVSMRKSNSTSMKSFNVDKSTKGKDIWIFTTMAICVLVLLICACLHIKYKNQQDCLDHHIIRSGHPQPLFNNRF